MSATIMQFDRDRRHLPPPPPTTEKTSYYVHIQRRSAGPRRIFWTDAHELPGSRCGEQFYPDTSDWTPEIISAIGDEAALLLPPQAGDGPLELALNAARGGMGHGDYLHLCVIRGRWRVRISVGWGRDLPSSVHEYLRSLTLTDDSWTPNEEARYEEITVRTRELNRKLARVRDLVRSNPDAWGSAIEPLLDRLDDGPGA